MKANVFSVKTSENVGVSDLAEGGPGRLVVYTEKALVELAGKKESKKEAKK